MAKVAGPISIVGEFFYPPGANRLGLIDWKDPQWPFLFKDSWQHITMFGFFLLSGVLNVVRRSHLWSWSVKLERAAEALVFYVVALILIAHIESKGSLETWAYCLSISLAILLALVLTVEIWLSNNVPL